MAFISKAEVTAVRKELKAQFPKFKFSVTGSNSLSINVTLLKGPRDFGKEHMQVNHYHLHNYPGHEDFFDRIIKIIKTAPANAEGGSEWFDDSDSMTDYFHTAFYFHLDVGKWNKPYEVTV